MRRDAARVSLACRPRVARVSGVARRFTFACAPFAPRRFGADL